MFCFHPICSPSCRLARQGRCTTWAMCTTPRGSSWVAASIRTRGSFPPKWRSLYRRLQTTTSKSNLTADNLFVTMSPLYVFCLWKTDEWPMLDFVWATQVTRVPIEHPRSLAYVTLLDLYKQGESWRPLPEAITVWRGFTWVALILSQRAWDRPWRSYFMCSTDFNIKDIIYTITQGWRWFNQVD